MKPINLAVVGVTGRNGQLLVDQHLKRVRDGAYWLLLSLIRKCTMNRCTVTFELYWLQIRLKITELQILSAQMNFKPLPTVVFWNTKSFPQVFTSRSERTHITRAHFAQDLGQSLKAEMFSSFDQCINFIRLHAENAGSLSMLKDTVMFIYLHCILRD